MFIQLSRIESSYGDTQPVFVNLNRIEYFYTINDMIGGKEVTVTRLTFNEGFLLVKEDVGTIQSYIISALRG